MGAKIFIITGTCGEYSDRNDWNICATFSKERAESLVEKLNRLSVFNAEFDKRVYDEFEIPYRESHIDVAAPSFRPAPTPEFRAVMDACSHGNGTPEFKARLRELQKEHIQRIDEYNKEHRRLYDIKLKADKVMSDAKEEWKKQNYHPTFDLEEVMPLCSGSRGTRYDYSEVEIL
jgi:hypothetical protein